MKSPAPIDLPAAHQFFSVECFNRAWEFIEKPDRSAEEAEQMIALSQASAWHWSQRADCATRNLSIGYWQLSRVYGLAGQSDNARRYGELCLQHSEQEEPFYLAYAYEALARAAKVAGDTSRMKQDAEKARTLAAEVEDLEERALIEKDLETLS